MLSDIIITAVEVGCLAVIFIFLYALASVAFKAVLPTKSKRQKSRLITYRNRFGLCLLLLFLLGSIVLVFFNGYIVFQGNSVAAFQLAQLRGVPQQFWNRLLISIGQCILIGVLAQLIQQFIVQRSLQRLKTFAQNIARIEANDESIGQFFDRLAQLVAIGTWVIVTVVCLNTLGAPLQVLAFANWALGTYVLIAIGTTIVMLVPIGVDTLDALSLDAPQPDQLLKIYQKIRYLLPIFKRCLELILCVGTAGLVLRYSPLIAGLAPYADKIIGLIALYFLTRVAVAIVESLVDEFFKRGKGLSDIARQRRLTMAPLLKSCLKYAIYIASLVGVLGILGLDPTPILAGAGILGLAIGFGAQNLVEDIVSGLFVLFENYYLVGDYVAAGRVEERPVEGVVEAIELRTTRLRHPDGQVQIIRNGEIGSVVNYSKQYIYATVDIPLAYNEDLAAVYPMIESVGQQLQEKHPTIVLEPTQVEGLESLGKNLVLVRSITKVKPGQHLHVQRIIRKMLKDRFDQENIELADYDPAPLTEL